MSNIVRTMPFQVSKKELERYFRTREKSSIRLLYSLSVLFGIGFAALGVSVSSPGAISFGLTVSLLLAIVAWSIPSSQAEKEFRHMRGSWIYRTRMSVQSEDGDLVLIHENGTTLRCPRRTLDVPFRIDDLIVFSQKDGLFVLIPSRAFPDQASEDMFMNTFKLDELDQKEDGATGELIHE